MPSKNSNKLASSEKRHKRATSIKTDGVSNPALKRVARSGGVKTVPAHMYGDGKRVLDNFFRITLECAITFAAMNGRVTIQSSDVKNALEMRGRTVYGSVRQTKRSRKQKISSNAESDEK